MIALSYADEGYEAFIKQLSRKVAPDNGLHDFTAQIIAQVVEGGDDALLVLAKQLEGINLRRSRLMASEADFVAASTAMKPAFKRSVGRCFSVLKTYAEHSKSVSWQAKNRAGVTFGERLRPYERVGVCLTCGKSDMIKAAIMTIGLAKAMKVKEIVVAATCGADANIFSTILGVLQLAGGGEALKVGGAAAIAAMTYGTKSIRKVDKIIGVGGVFIAEALKQTFGVVAAEYFRGEQEALILADKYGDAAHIAANMLANAEASPTSTLGCITNSTTLFNKIKNELNKKIKDAEVVKPLRAAIKSNTFLLRAKNFTEAVRLANVFCPSKVRLLCAKPQTWMSQLHNVGAIYLGSSFIVGNQELLFCPFALTPANGSSRSFSCLKADSFQRTSGLVKLSKSSLNLSLPIIKEFGNI